MLFKNPTKNSHSVQSRSPLLYPPYSPCSPLFTILALLTPASLLYSLTHPTSPLSVPMPMGMLPTAKTVQTQRSYHISITTQNLQNTLENTGTTNY
ncbi:MAG: hypothetical protein LBQ31_10785 [Bacteroidales bacterium]|nr:hypothetical protein [Bacteroidales bacterium]